MAGSEEPPQRAPAVEPPALVEMAARDLVLEHQHAPVQEQLVAECRPVGAEG